MLTTVASKIFRRFADTKALAKVTLPELKYSYSAL